MLGFNYVIGQGELKYVDRIAGALTLIGRLFQESDFDQTANSHLMRPVDTKKVEKQISTVLRNELVHGNEGWLSEEDPDDQSRLGKKVLWIVDPIDGTMEMVQRRPEWCVSVGLIVDGQAFAGGIYNPSTRETFLGSLPTGLTYNGKRVVKRQGNSLDRAIVLASRQEYNRGEWAQFENRGFTIRPTGSIAYKLALVSAGIADATWTLSPKHEWDIAGGVALVNSSGGSVQGIGQQKITFNQRIPRVSGLIAAHKGVIESCHSQIVLNCLR